MAVDNNIHIARRIQHAVTGLVLIVISHIIPPYPAGCLLLFLATAAFYNIHRKRVQDPTWDDWYLQNFGSLLRTHEIGEWEEVDLKNNKRRWTSIPALPGAFYFLLGVAFSTFLFPANVARTSVLVLSISDPIAGLVGTWFTRQGNNIAWRRFLPRCNAPLEGGPSVAGSFGFAVSTILCTYVYIPSRNSTRRSMMSFSSRVFIGLVSSMTEAVGGRHLPFFGTIADDNLLIPLIVGCLVCWLDSSD